MKWELDALKILARNSSVPGVALQDAISEIEKQAETIKRQAKELEQARRDIGRKDDALQLYAEFNTALNVALGLPEDNENDHAPLEIVHRMRTQITELEAECKRLKRMVDWALTPATQESLQKDFDHCDKLTGANDGNKLDT